MKKNRMMRLASVLLIMTLLSTSVISGTFAKYTRTANATDVARVARWSFNVNGTDITTNAIAFDLFNTVTDSDYTTEETDVYKVDGSTTIIAPGTSGAFAINLENTSEVNATYDIDFTVSTTAIPIEYSLDKATWSTTVADIDLTGKWLAMGGGAETVNVYWRWSYESDIAGWDDTKDTALGIAAQGAPQTIVVTAQITATQVD